MLKNLIKWNIIAKREAEILLMFLSTIEQQLDKKRYHLQKVFIFYFKSTYSHSSSTYPISMPKNFQAMRHERQRTRTTQMNPAAIRSKSWRPSLQSISEATIWFVLSTFSCHMLFVNPLPLSFPDVLHRCTSNVSKKIH